MSNTPSLRQHLQQACSWLSLGAIASAIPLSVTLPAQAQVYSDIAGHWAEPCIQNLRQQGIVSGYPNGTFRPDSVISRAEYAAMMNRAFPDVQPDRSAINFTDVPTDYWGEDAIRTAYRKGFLSGYPDQTFRPRDLIERAEAFVALASGLDYTVPESPRQILSATYTDAEKIPDYAADQIAAATQQGIVISPPQPNVGRLMGPNDPATRAQVAASLCEIKFENSGVPEAYVVNAAQPDNGTPLALGQTCTNEAAGYTIRYPTGWQTNPGDVTEQCRVFDPAAITLPERSESFDEAIHIRVDRVPFEQVTDETSISERQLSRRETTIDGHQAVVVEAESTGQALLPEGIRSYRYAVNLNGQTLIASTYDVQGTQYQRNKQVLDQMINTLDITR